MTTQQTIGHPRANKARHPTLWADVSDLPFSKSNFYFAFDAPHRAEGLERCQQMSFLSRLLARRPDPNRPFVEYPDGRLQSASEALEHGLRVYRKEGGGRRAFISWQGQGGRVDSYHIVDLSLVGDVVSFREVPIDLERACIAEGFAFDSLRQPEMTELSIASLSEKEAATLIEALLVKHVGMKRFEDSHDFCVAFKYEKKG